MLVEWLDSLHFYKQVNELGLEDHFLITINIVRMCCLGTTLKQIIIQEISYTVQMLKH